ncbi:MAG: pilus assembly PilX family protein [Burkholderiales bacterium]
MNATFTTPTLSRPSRIAARGQRGIVLITALILLVVLTLVALLAVQGSISGEQVSRNLRTSATAAQAAELALRNCEDHLLAAMPSYSINPAPPDPDTPIELWRTAANWANSTMYNTITAVLTNSLDASSRPLPVLPLCMIELNPLPPGELGAQNRQSYLITARGFSADYRVNGSGQVVSGSEVWLQSFFRR